MALFSPFIVIKREKKMVMVGEGRTIHFIAHAFGLLKEYSQFSVKGSQAEDDVKDCSR